MLRARFVVLPLVLLGPPTGYLASLQVSEALDARESRRIEREYEERVAPASEALRGIRLDGLAACPRLKLAEDACLRGTAEVEPTSDALVRALRAAGATDVRPECGRTPTMVAVCRVGATLRGSRVSAVVGREFVARKPTGTVRVTMTAFPPPY